MKKIRALIVEDEILTAEALSLDLEEIGYEVCALESSGEAAIEAADKERPDIVLMDGKLKGHISGFEAAKAILSRFGIPVIFITGYSEQEIREKAGEMADGIRVVGKPIALSDITEAVASALKEKSPDSENPPVTEP